VFVHILALSAKFQLSAFGSVSLAPVTTENFRGRLAVFVAGWENGSFRAITSDRSVVGRRIDDTRNDISNWCSLNADSVGTRQQSNPATCGRQRCESGLESEARLFASWAEDYRVRKLDECNRL